MAFPVEFAAQDFGSHFGDGRPAVARLRLAAEADIEVWERWKGAYADTEDSDVAHWPLRELVALAQSSDSWMALAVSSRDPAAEPQTEQRLEALMVMSIQRNGSRLDPRHDTVYVEYLLTAPHNLRPTGSLAPQNSLPGVATILARTAERLSIGLTFQGRVGLHSRPRSEGFYRDKLHYSDLGLEKTIDGEWRYFEAAAVDSPVEGLNDAQSHHS